MARLVRWLGAYGRGQSVATIAAFESRPGREIAAEWIPTGGRSGLRSPLVGLLLDPACARRIYGADCWSADAGDGVLRARRATTVSWRATSRAKATGAYCEAVVSRPHHLAVVYRPGGQTFAAEIAEIMGLPIRPWLDRGGAPTRPLRGVGAGRVRHSPECRILTIDGHSITLWLPVGMSYSSAYHLAAGVAAEEGYALAPDWALTPTRSWRLSPEELRSALQRTISAYAPDATAPPRRPRRRSRRGGRRRK